MTFISVLLKILDGGELIAGGSPVSENYMETCFSSNVAGASTTLASYTEIGLKHKLQIIPACLFVFADCMAVRLIARGMLTPTKPITALQYL